LANTKSQTIAKGKPMPGTDVVIVESPAKARTIGRFLGSDYDVIATKGHMRGLASKGLNVDIDNDFEPTYSLERGSGVVLTEIKKKVRSAGTVYLATDPDREGEAIAWHLLEELGEKVLSGKDVRRVVFHEITRSAVDDAFADYGVLDMDLVNAQQARRILDRLVGYKVSPVLWSRVRRGLSAGRVQSVALRLTVDREREIEAFNPVEYWSILTRLAKTVESRMKFRATLHAIDGKRGGGKSDR